MPLPRISALWLSVGLNIALGSALAVVAVLPLLDPFPGFPPDPERLRPIVEARVTRIVDQLELEPAVRAELLNLTRQTVDSLVQDARHMHERRFEDAMNLLDNPHRPGTADEMTSRTLADQALFVGRIHGALAQAAQMLDHSERERLKALLQTERAALLSRPR